ADKIALPMSRDGTIINTSWPFTNRHRVFNLSQPVALETGMSGADRPAPGLGFKSPEPSESAHQPKTDKPMEMNTLSTKRQMLISLASYVVLFAAVFAIGFVVPIRF
ncbi:MAG: hypothetical protein ACR2O0_07810, partial [Rhizobiaceae bacterium]